MEVKLILKTLHRVTCYPKLLGLLPFEFSTSSNKLIVLTSKRYLFRYYITLSVVVLIKLISIVSLILNIFVLKTFSFSEKLDVLQTFYYFPISLLSLINATQTCWRIHEISSSVNTFIQFYQRIQGYYTYI